jgi:hypothetical protein
LLRRNRLAGYLHGAEQRGDPKDPLFRAIGRGTGQFTGTVLPQANACAMIGRHAAAGSATKLGNHSSRATWITAYLKNGGTLEKAAAMANHASTRTAQLYDRRREEVSLEEVERIVIRREYRLSKRKIFDEGGSDQRNRKLCGRGSRAAQAL